MRTRFIVIPGLTMAYSTFSKAQNLQTTENLKAVLDKVWQTEQAPIHLRDSLMRIYGADSKQFHKYQTIYKQNHKINEQIVKTCSINTVGQPKK
ncbi:hypothetical protein PbJCM13498_22820 [Prolixibacter bellariivorans]|uniref:DUF4296 domain-containing protein n=1 Tax=Prolixibacter bellariivorans TaxID=314319 RepID=A0A5M4AZU5_9BACT|nr:hypothetical protein [Prolixibacter bellariivorans]GET33419.1 hypothetical protein PbJCM13498_22820 [Prolixibacter bellariivorans]